MAQIKSGDAGNDKNKQRDRTLRAPLGRPLPGNGAWPSLKEVSLDERDTFIPLVEIGGGMCQLFIGIVIGHAKRYTQGVRKVKCRKRPQRSVPRPSPYPFSMRPPL
jgi:hypothetical protein